MNKENLLRLSKINKEMSRLNLEKNYEDEEIINFLNNNYKIELEKIKTDFVNNHRKREYVDNFYFNYNINIDDNFYNKIIIYSSFKRIYLENSPYFYNIDYDECEIYFYNDIIIILNKNSMSTLEYGSHCIELDIDILCNLEKDVINKIKLEINI